MPSSGPCFQVEHGPIKKRKQNSRTEFSFLSTLSIFFILVKVLLARFECWGISQPPLNRDERKHRRQREEVTNCATDAVQYWMVLQELHGIFFFIIKNYNLGIFNEKQVAVKTFKTVSKISLLPTAFSKSSAEQHDTSQLITREWRVSQEALSCWLNWLWKKYHICPFGAWQARFIKQLFFFFELASFQQMLLLDSYTNGHTTE